MGKWIFKVAVFCLALAGFVGGLILLGQWARNDLRERDRYRTAFADIDVDPPPGMDRPAFLDEAQYFGSMPNAVSLLDSDLAEQLATAFGQHPWVAKVAEVRVILPQTIKVRLIYRKPVLAVPVGDILRAVDGEGVLLPRRAATDGLPRFTGKALPPAGPDGSRWGDPGVETQARSLAP